MGWFLQVTIGTTACESVNAAANIFLGQVCLICLLCSIPASLHACILK